MRRDIVDVLFPAPIEPIHVTVTEGVATLTGRVGESARVDVAMRLVRGVEGVVGVDCRLTAATRHDPPPAVYERTLGGIRSQRQPSTPPLAPVRIPPLGPIRFHS
ncbi:BON domain-containing protein [Streptomyces sp. NBC_00557]|uniref:BON domain-containing protein n=1 Tax=Streptomyces sp. NBC_00557 TaxID=2975776 RepID=UPI003FCEDE09